MNDKWKFTIITITAALLMMGFMTYSPSSPPNTHELVIMKIDGIWKVVDAADHTKFTLKAKKKDVIVWTIIGSDASFQFPANLLDPVDEGDNLTDGYTKYLKDGKKLKLKVKETAEAGTYEYAVFCSVDGVFAIGGSPPKIIID